MVSVTILGNNSAVPAFNRHPTSQVVTIEGENILLDCGEGTQIQLIRYKIRRRKISHIFISHLHGDHYFGLIGLLNSFALLGRQQDLHVYGPSPLKEIVELQLKVADTHLSYNLYLYDVNKPGLLTETENFSVTAFKTNHRIECYGYVVKEKKYLRKLLSEKAEEFNIPKSFYTSLKQGFDYVSPEGNTIANDLVTEAATPGQVYAFCADTRYDESLLDYITGADMMYHETTYLDNFRERATERFHSTTRQAATLAVKAGVKKLLIGHFSSKYDTLEEFEKEAREVFPDTDLAIEGVTYTV